MAQTKEQIKTPEKNLNKLEISNLSDVEFKKMKRELEDSGTPPKVPTSEL